MVQFTEAWWWGWGGLGMYGYGLGYPYWGMGYYGLWGRKKREDTSVVCRFLSKTSEFECNLGLVTCPAVANFALFEKPYEIFGIGTNEFEGRYHLYPKNVRDEVFLNYEFPNGQVCLYNKEAQGVYGIQITDAACYQRVIELFRIIKAPIEFNVTVAASLTAVPLYGTILIE